VLLHHHSRDGVDVVTVSGRVEPQDVGPLVQAVEAAYAGRPRGVVLDLRDATTLAVEAVEALRALAAGARPWPWTSLGLAAPVVPHLLDPEGLPVHPDCEEALRHVDDRSTARRERIVVAHDELGPAQARAAVAEAVARLGVQAAGEDLALIVSEMVTNAVRYAQAPVALEIEADGTTVLVAVADGSPALPAPRPHDEQAEGGRGLLLIQMLAREHGVRPEILGKTVWAVLPLGASAH